MIETVKICLRGGPVVYRANNCTGAFHRNGFLTTPER